MSKKRQIGSITDLPSNVALENNSRTVFRPVGSISSNVNSTSVIRGLQHADGAAFVQGKSRGNQNATFSSTSKTAATYLNNTAYNPVLAAAVFEKAQPSLNNGQSNGTGSVITGVPGVSRDLHLTAASTLTVLVASTSVSAAGVVGVKASIGIKLRKQLKTPTLSGISEPLTAATLDHPVLRRTVDAPASQMWVDFYRPKTCTDVVGNAKAKAALHVWFEAGHTKACLITGPTGIGKTCLTESFFNDKKLEKCDCRAVGVSVTTVVTNLLYRKRTAGMALSQVGLIIDEIHTLTSEERSGLASILSKPFPKGAPPVICIVDSDILPSVYQSVKSACHLVPMYKPYSLLDDATCLARKLRGLSKRRLSTVQLQAAVEQSLGDLRAMTIMMEWLSVSHMNDRKPVAAGGGSSLSPYQHAQRVSPDLFLTPFEATRQLLHPVLFVRAEALINTDVLMSLFVFENAYGALPKQGGGGGGVSSSLSSELDLNAMAEFADGISLAEVFDSHRSHHFSDVSRSVLASAVCKYYSHPNARPRAPLQFPAYLGKCSTQNANKRRLIEMRTRSFMERRAGSMDGAPTESRDPLHVTMSGLRGFVLNEVPTLMSVHKEDILFLSEYKKRFK